MDAIKEQTNILRFLDRVLDRLGKIGLVPEKAISDIMDTLYTITQAAFCSKVSVPPGLESGKVLQEGALPALVSLKAGCISDGIQDSTSPLEHRLAAIQHLVNKTAVYASQYGHSGGEHHHDTLELDALLLDTDMPTVGAPNEAYEEEADTDRPVASPVFSMWRRSFYLPPAGALGPAMEIRPGHRNAQGKWVLFGTMVQFVLQDVGRAPELCNFGDPLCVSASKYYGCPDRRCPSTTVVRRS